LISLPFRELRLILLLGIQSSKKKVKQKVKTCVRYAVATGFFEREIIREFVRRIKLVISNEREVENG
jgi:hypothetical protein